MNHKSGRKTTKLSAKVVRASAPRLRLGQNRVEFYVGKTISGFRIRKKALAYTTNLERDVDIYFTDVTLDPGVPRELFLGDFSLQR